MVDIITRQMIQTDELSQYSNLMALLQLGEIHIMVDLELQQILGTQKYIQISEVSLLWKMMDLLLLGKVQVGVDHELRRIVDIQKYIQHT